MDHPRRTLEQARAAWPHLVAAARAGTVMTYGDLAGWVDLPPRRIGPPLELIQTECAARGWPPLQALAVYKATGMPGPGYTATARAGPGYVAALAAVRAFDWPDTAPF